MKVKCRECGEKLEKDYAVKIEHITNSGNKQNKYYHEKCYKFREKENKQWDRLENELINLLEIPVLNKEMVTSLVDLRNGVIKPKDRKNKNKTKSGYSYEIIRRAILKKKKEIKDNYKDKSWWYIHAIIGSECPRVYREEKKKIENKKIREQFEKEKNKEDKEKKEIKIKNNRNEKESSSILEVEDISEL